MKSIVITAMCHLIVCSCIFGQLSGDVENKKYTATVDQRNVSDKDLQNAKVSDSSVNHTADHMASIDVLLKQGLYLQIKKRLDQKERKTWQVSDYAIYSFVETQLSQRFETYALAQKGQTHYLGELAIVICYREGIGVRRNSKEAKKRTLKLFQKLSGAKHKNDLQLYVLAQLAYQLDHEKTTAYLDQACEQKVAGAINLRGKLHQEHRQYAQAFVAYKQAADMGLAEAQKNVSYFYSMGKGVKADQKLALTYSQKAANGGDVYGMINMAVSYDEMGDSRKSHQSAERAAKTEHWAGLLEKGFAMIHHHYGYEVNKVEGFKCIKESAKSRQSIPLLHLGNLYADGVGVEQDMDKAVLLYKCAYLMGEGAVVSTAAKKLFYHYMKQKNSESLRKFWQQKSIGAFSNRESAVYGTGTPPEKNEEYEKELQSIDPMKIDL